ncbi:MAG: hypothetical protein ACLRYE_14480 [Gemmiger formicilis]|uniref:hypothetical protein n=1 Tax=Gemmiger formicilis TaxID=745368 RepID=UPI0039A39C06
MAAKEKRHDFFMHFVMVVISVICILPLILLVIVSLSSEESLVTNGYSFFQLVGALMPTNICFTAPQSIRHTACRFLSPLWEQSWRYV